MCDYDTFPFAAQALGDEASMTVFGGRLAAQQAGLVKFSGLMPLLGPAFF